MNGQQNFMIHVDRSSDLIVPPFLKRRGLAGFKYPELEKVGPEVFDLRKVRRLLPRDCVNLFGKFISKGSEILGLGLEESPRPVIGKEIHDYVVNHKTLVECLGFREVLTIQEKGVEFFREVFGEGVVVFFLKGIAEDKVGGRHAPFLHILEGKLTLAVRHLDREWDEKDLMVLYP